MHSFEFLSHPADLRMLVKGSTLQDVFHAAFDGMNDVFKKDFCTTNPQATIEDEIVLTSVDYAMLLVEFLSEVLTKTYENKAIFCNLNLLNLHNTSLRATISGTHVDEFDEDVKAVTYHEAEFTHNERGEYETVLVFDL